MARRVIEQVVSDLSGDEISDGKAWTMTITPPDGRSRSFRLDISESEAKSFTGKGTEVKRRRRRTSGATPTKAPANGRRRGKTP